MIHQSCFYKRVRMICSIVARVLFLYLISHPYLHDLNLNFGTNLGGFSNQMLLNSRFFFSQWFMFVVGREYFILYFIDTIPFGSSYPVIITSFLGTNVCLKEKMFQPPPHTCWLAASWISYIYFLTLLRLNFSHPFSGPELWKPCVLYTKKTSIV